jgi:hypothetical protein
VSDRRVMKVLWPAMIVLFLDHARVVSGAVHTCAVSDGTTHCVSELSKVMGQYLKLVLSGLLVATEMH